MKVYLHEKQSHHLYVLEARDNIPIYLLEIDQILLLEILVSEQACQDCTGIETNPVSCMLNIPNCGDVPHTIGDLSLTSRGSCVSSQMISLTW